MRRLLVLPLALILWTSAFLRAEPIPNKGQELAKVLDAMQVEKHWLAGVPVNWKTGQRDPLVRQHATHCSAFVAAACDRLGVYILRPPEHSQVLLANAQQRWLLKQGREKGWTLVPTWAEAQRLANRGTLVVASYRNQDRRKPGHIAVVRPSDKDAKEIETEGPDIIAAGRHNYNRVGLVQGFKSHPKDEVRFFAYRPAALPPVSGKPGEAP